MDGKASSPKKAEEELRESEARQAFLLKLSDALRPLFAANSIKDAAARLLVDHLGASYSSYNECNEEFGWVSNESVNNTNSLAGTYKLSEYSSAMAVLRSGRDLVIPDVLDFPDFPDEERARCVVLNIRANISVPLIKDGKLVATVTVKQTTPRNWTPEEVELVRETAERTWAAVERAKAEEALRESREEVERQANFFNAMLANTLDAFIVLDRDKQFVYANRRMQELWGMTRGEHLGKTTAELGGYTSELSELVFRQVNAVFETGLPATGERISEMDNSIYFEYVFSPVYGKGGSMDYVCGVAHDITERKRHELMLSSQAAQLARQAKELEMKNKLVTDFFINISHEFKTPLTILMLGLELLETKASRMDGGAAFAGNLAAMKQNSYRLSRLVANLLDITKLDAGFMQPKWEETDVTGILRNLAQSVQPYAVQKELSLEYVCDEAEIPFTTDNFMLERIMLNLLSNAIKHTPAGGRITLVCTAKGDKISIAVADTGEGIPESKQAIIFDRFSQVDTRMTRASEGTGIGLALAKSLVELLGGKISVASTPGAGSTFLVELPNVKKEATNGTVEQGNLRIDKRVQIELSDIIVS